MSSSRSIMTGGSRWRHTTSTKMVQQWWRHTLVCVKFGFNAWLNLKSWIFSVDFVTTFFRVDNDDDDKADADVKDVVSVLGVFVFADNDDDEDDDDDLFVFSTTTTVQRRARWNVGVLSTRLAEDDALGSTLASASSAITDRCVWYSECKQYGSFKR